MNVGPSSEVGRELKVTELKPKTVVAVKPPLPLGTPPLYLTLWVDEVDLENKVVIFYAGETRTLVLNFIHDDGTIRDDKDRIIHVYEFLGKV